MSNFQTNGWRAEAVEKFRTRMVYSWSAGILARRSSSSFTIFADWKSALRLNFSTASASLPAEGDPFDESHYLFQMKF